MQTSVRALVSLALIVATAMAECPTVSQSQLEQLFCNKAVVFEGKLSRGDSSPSQNGPYGYSISSAYGFRVHQHFKGPEASDITVRRYWQSSDNCDDTAFGDMADSYLVLANASNEVDPCQFGFSWDCVPNEFRAELEAGSISC